MWIKKAASSLYLSILLRMFLSGLLCLLLFFALISFSNSYVARQNAVFLKRQKDNIDIFVSEISQIVIEEELTLREARSYNFTDDDSMYGIYFFGISGEDDTASFDEFNPDIFMDTLSDFGNISFISNQHIYEIPFADEQGFLLVSSSSVENISTTLYIISAAITVAIFFSLSLYLIYIQLSYLKTIEAGINKISDESILYKIPIRGENELARLAVSINSMGDNLHQKMETERQDKIKQRLLITNISHDLRTPLTSIIGYIDIANAKLPPEHEAYNHIKIAKENGLRLEKLINDLFLYSRLISDDTVVNVQKLDLNIVLRQIFELKTEDIIFNPSDITNYAYFDAENFYRVIDNLISNASKYSVKGSEITVSTRTEMGKAIIEVQNTSSKHIDIDVEELKNRLYTAHESRKGGAGLGLSIATALLKTMNGTLELSYINDTFTATVKLETAEG